MGTECKTTCIAAWFVTRPPYGRGILWRQLYLSILAVPERRWPWPGGCLRLTAVWKHWHGHRVQNDLYSGLGCPKFSVWKGHALAPVIFVWLAVPVSEQRWPRPGVCLKIGGGGAIFVSLLVCELVTSYNSWYMRVNNQSIGARVSVKFLCSCEGFLLALKVFTSNLLCNIFFMMSTQMSE